jgi:hypothetical protein
MTFSVCPKNVRTRVFFLKTIMFLGGEYVTPRPGPILEIDTNVPLGRHNGLWTYTIGQGARLPGLATKLFVASKDHRNNAIYVALPESVQLPFPPPRFVPLWCLLSDLFFFQFRCCLCCSQPPSIIHINYCFEQFLVDMARRAPNFRVHA